MEIFLTLLAKLVPIYVVMGAGYGFARITGNIIGGLAVLQIYFIMPVVIFANAATLELSWHLLALPLTLFLLCLAISGTTYFATRARRDGTGALMGQATGSANMAYLGVPVALAVFPESMLPLYLFTMVASTTYESSIGYYFLARGKFTPRDALKKVFRLPILHAVIAGLVFGALHLTLPTGWQGIIRDFRGSFVILGSLIVGLGLGQVKKWEFDFRFFGLLMGIKFVVWPLAALALVHIEQALGIMRPEYAPIILLMSLMPLAANTTAFAALVGVHPEKAATAVAGSTVLSFITLPLSAIILHLV